MKNYRYKLILLFIILQLINISAQEYENCFLNDFTVREAVIPPYANYNRPTSIPTVTVSIDFNDTLNRISKYIFGNAVAVWVSKDVNNPTLVGYLQKLSPTLIRYPGGSWSDIYFWNGNPGDLPSTIPDSEGEPVSLGPRFGPGYKPTFDSYLDMCDQIGTQGLITINYGYARYGLSDRPAEQAAHLAAEWVRNDNGKTKFWEIGNESAGPWEAGWRIDTAVNKDEQPLIINGEIYGKHFNIFADSMRKAAAEVGAEIFVGAQIIQYDGTNSWNVADRGWNESVFGEVGDTADFYVVHNYFGGDESNPRTYLNTALNYINDMHEFIHHDIEVKNAVLRPIALTEWNINANNNVKTSVINGMQGVLAMSELARLGYGMSCRWLIANWEGDGMFYHRDPVNPNIPAWNPRPDFYYLYYLQKYFGSYFLGSEVTGSTDIKAYTTLFNSGKIGVVLVNMGVTGQAVQIDLENTGYGNRYYYHSLKGGPDEPYYSKYVYVNDSGPEPTRWGPLQNLENIKARSDTLIYPIKINSLGYSVQYILIETGDSVLQHVNVDSLSISTENDILSITEDNGTIQFLAGVSPWNATDNGVIWSTSDSSVAIIDHFGLLKAIFNGSVTVTATTADGGFKDSLAVTVSNQRYEVTGISLITETGTRLINTEGGALQVIPVIEPENAEDKTVSWSVSDTNLASISSNGLITAKQDGRVVVTCITNDGGLSASISISISGQPTGVIDYSLARLKVYPVPAENILLIENDHRVLFYEITNAEGKILKIVNNPGLKTEVNIMSLDRGVYFIRAQSNKGVRVIRFIK